MKKLKTQRKNLNSLAFLKSYGVKNKSKGEAWARFFFDFENSDLIFDPNFIQFEGYFGEFFLHLS